MPKEEFEMELKDPKEIAAGNFLSPADIGSSKIVIIEEAPHLVESQFKTGDDKPRMQYRILVRVPAIKQAKLWTLNNTTYSKLFRAFGKKSAAWVGKKIKATVVKQMVRAELRDVIYGEPAT